MSTQIETAWVQQYSANVTMLAQQMDARLPQTVTIDNLSAEVGYRDQVGAVDVVQRLSRHADTPFTEVPHARRQFTTLDWEFGEIIDKQDLQRALTNPQSSYAQAAAAAFNRRRDRTILEGIFADARTGKTGSSTVSFTSGNQIPVNFVESGSAADSSLTIAKLRRARELLLDAEAGESDFYIVCSQRELNALLRTVEVTSSDYNTTKALVDGQVDTFMGFRFVRVPSSLLLVNGASNRRIPAYHKSGVLFAQTGDTTFRVAEDPTKGFNYRLYGSASFGATRLEEPKCVEIICHPTTF
jgi:hypothetical protein